jgi:CRP-like cAMP-binding protein
MDMQAARRGWGGRGARRGGEGAFDMNSAMQQAAPIAAVDLPTLRTRSVIFSALNDQDCLNLLDLARVVVVPPRKTVCQAGDSGDAMYVVMSGRAKVSLVSEEGKEIILSFIEPGQIFGEMSLLDGLPRSANVSTMDESRLLVLWRKDLVPYLESHPAVTLKLLAALSQKLRKTNGLIEDLNFLNLPARLARLLLNLADQYGKPVPQGREISIKLSQEELGNLVGASRESINKQFRLWVETGLMEYQHGILVMKNTETFEDISTTPG